MANALPDFITRKIYVKGSLKKWEDGFCFELNNSFAPVVVQRFGLEVDGRSIEAGKISVTPGGEARRDATSISKESPLPLSIHMPYSVQVTGSALPTTSLIMTADTRDAGEVLMRIPLKATKSAKTAGDGWELPAWLRPTLKAKVTIKSEDVIGEISPFVYGQFIEHLERCIYGGMWHADGSAPREDVMALVAPLKVPLLRYPGGNFASGYHWEDGIGPKDARPARFDEAWSAPESNQVGTDEFLALTQRLGTEPYLVVNDGSGTPEEAARWVEYCNSTSGSQAERRARNGHSEPYSVKVWGIGNEVWGRWQIGATSAEQYAERLARFARAMRAVDASIRLVAVGCGVASDSPDDPGRQWNQAVLRTAGSLIDDLSFHLYQPDQDGWQEEYNLQALHRTLLAAPLAAEQMIQRMTAQIVELSPGKKIGVAFDEWNLWLAPPAGSASMHGMIYTMRDALYCAGMLNVFQRQCGALSMANLAQLVNVLPLIVTDDTRAFSTSIYWPFRMYTRMENLALRAQVESPMFDSEGLGRNVPARQSTPWLDVAATRSSDGNRVCMGFINRHPSRRMNVEISLEGFAALTIASAEILTAKPLESNSFEQPAAVSPQVARLPLLRGGMLRLTLPACALLVINLEC